MQGFKKEILIAAIFPFAIALTIEFFQQELINGGLSLATFNLIDEVLYIIASILFLASVWKGQMSQRAKTIWTLVLVMPFALKVVPLLTGKKLLPLLFGK